MFVIDYLKASDTNRILVPPFHSGHLGLLPRSATQTITLLQSARNFAGCELCITPYDRPLEHLFRLKCVLREERGVVHRLLRAIAAMDINVLSWESATLESNGGHGVFMLLDWSTTTWPSKVGLSKNLQELFFPRLSGIIPPDDLRYIRLLRQILGQCADILLWENDSGDGTALPRLRLSEFEETRLIASRGTIQISPAATHRARLDEAGVAFDIHPQVAADARIATGRDEGGPLHYILVSDIESKTLRVFIPRRGREKRMVHLGFSHKNRPGALCAITEFIAKNQFTIVSGLVRKMTDERNILEVTLEHESHDVSRDDLVANPQQWVASNLHLADDRIQTRLRYYGVTLQPPLYPKESRFESTSLFDESAPTAEFLKVVPAEEAERDVLKMSSQAATNPSFRARRWLTSLMFAPDWGPHGKPSIFLSYPKAAKGQAALIRAALGKVFHFLELQDANVAHITEGAIELIVSAHYFIGIWHPESGSGRQQSLSPWMPFEYGVALSHNKPCVILSHSELPGFLADRISRDTGRIVYTDLSSQPDKLHDLQQRCEPWVLGHQRLSL